MPPVAAERNPCRRAAPTGGPSQELLSTLGVLRTARTKADRAPRWVRRTGSGTAYRRFIRVVDVPAAHRRVWIVPQQDVTNRFLPSDACIRTLPRSWRDDARQERRRDRKRPPLEGVDIAVVTPRGESHGGAGSPGAEGLRRRGMVHIDGAQGDRKTVVVGLAPDGVARVRIVLPGHRDERGREQPQREAVVPVRENVYGTVLPMPFDFEFVDPVVTWLDAAGTEVGPSEQAF